MLLVYMSVVCLGVQIGPQIYIVTSQNFFKYKFPYTGLENYQHWISYFVRAQICISWSLQAMSRLHS